MVEQMQLKAYAKGGPSVESSFSCLSFITRRYCYICCYWNSRSFGYLYPVAFFAMRGGVGAGGYTTLYTAVMLLKDLWKVDKLFCFGL